MDEAEIAKQKYIGVLVGSLDAPNQTFLVDCHPLDSGSNANSGIILHTVDDILRQLEIKRENFSLFSTDTARYKFLAGKALKELSKQQQSKSKIARKIFMMLVCHLLLTL